MNSPSSAVFVIEAGAKAALPVIESLARLGLRVVVGSDRWINSGFFSRHAWRRHIYPSPRFERRRFQSWLIEYLRLGEIEVVIPIGHYGSEAICEIQDEVRQYSKLTMPDRATFLKGFGKIATLQTAIEVGVPIPKSWFPAGVRHLESIDDLIETWPVLVKPDVGAGARGIVWCYSRDELKERYAHVMASHGSCFVQEFVPPGGTQFKVDLLVDGDQRLLAGVAYAKVRMYPPRGGSSTLNVSVHRPDIISMAYSMLQALKWVGFCDFDFIEDPRDGVIKLMEINPRLPESFNMGPTVGIDFARLIYEISVGSRIEPHSSYPPDRVLRFLPGDILWFLSVGNNERFGCRPNWFSFCRKGVSYQLLRLSDLGPIVGYLLENALLVCDRKTLTERLRT